MVSAAKTRGWRPLVMLVITVAILWFVFRVQEVLLAFAAGAAIAYILYRPMTFLERKGLPRFWSILGVYLGLAFIITMIIWAAVPAVMREAANMAQLYPDYVQNMHTLTDHLEGIPETSGMRRLLAENIHYIENVAYDAVQKFFDSLFRLLENLLAIVFAPILAFYILADWERIRDWFLELLPCTARQESRLIFQEIDRVLYEYIKGYLIIASMVGLGTGAAAAVIGVRFPLAIGLMVGFTNLIPCFGAFLGGIPAVAIAWSQSLQQALYMTLAVIGIQQLDANLFTPRIIGGKLGLHPLVVIFALLAGASIFGIWGMILAVPAAAILKILGGWAFLKLVA